MQSLTPQHPAQLPPSSPVLTAGRLSGESDAMQALITRVIAIAPSNVNVLINGETGSGKELCAEALHLLSAQDQNKWIPINCASLPSDLLIAELFGCTSGAFTNAQQRDGLITSAEGGTLFLDEIGELSLAAQATLLRVIETGELRALGSDRVKRVSFRLICATHRDLTQLVAEGKFRADLYHRISVITLYVPPLRKRGKDLMGLIQCLAPKLMGRLDASAIRLLQAYAWPGNVRELKNVLERTEAEFSSGELCADHLRLPIRGPWLIKSDSLIQESQSASGPMNDDEATLEETHLFTPKEDKFLVTGPPVSNTPLHPSPHHPSQPPSAASQALKPNYEVQHYPHIRLVSSHEQSDHQLIPLIPTMKFSELRDRYFQEVLMRANGNISLAARWLGVSRSLVYRRIQKRRAKQIA